MKKFKSIVLIVFWVMLGIPDMAQAQQVTSPKEYFGFNIGDDYKLANYTQMDGYFKKLASESDRVLIRPIGMTEEGREQYVMVVSSPENLQKVDYYREISQRMGRAEGLTDAEAQRLSREGKPVIWIDGGMHSTETVGSHQLVEMYYQLLNRTDQEVTTILDKVIIVMCHINPDGQELIGDWYMQESDETKRNMSIPRLYQKYVGHDNNRDFYMMNMKEATNVSLQLFVEWLPQVIYNHHQTSPAGTIVAGPPYRGPFNHVFDPLLITSIDGVGSAMINRLNQEGKPGYTRLGGSVFSTWWNGGLRTVPYFHNMVGILTETFGSPTPMEVPLVLDRLVPDNNTPNPIAPQKWHFRQSIDYSVSMNYAILDYASRYGDQLLYNFYTMGRNAIEKGNSDNWTLYPKFAEEVKNRYEADKAKGTVPANPTDANPFMRGNTIPSSYYDQVYRNKEYRDPRAYILSADQADFGTAVKFLNALIKSGVGVHRAQSDFAFQGKSYPKGSYIVKANQAFRPHIMDMFEPQDHPNDLLFEGGPPIRPYDAAGWTLAIQMGVEYDRVYEALDGPFEKLPYGQLLDLPNYDFVNSRNGYLLDVSVNNSFAVVNELLKTGINVSRLGQDDQGLKAGSFYVESKGGSALQKAAAAYGVPVQSAQQKPKNTIAIKPSRIALFDHYGGSMPSGWVRWLLEQFDYEFNIVYPNDINNGLLDGKYDVVVFTGDGLPDAQGRDAGMWNRIPSTDLVPDDYRPWLGKLDMANSVPKIKSFIEGGGKVVTIGTNSNLAFHLGLPVQNKLYENGKAIPSEKFFVPTSILRSKVNVGQPSTWGLDDEIGVMYNNNPVFSFASNSTQLEPIIWFDNQELLLSGWAWGENYLNNGVSAFKASIGKGEYYAFGPDIMYRGQSHSTFKLLFNQLYR